MNLIISHYEKTILITKITKYEKMENLGLFLADFDLF